MKPFFRLLAWLPLALCWPAAAQTGGTNDFEAQTNGGYRLVLGTNWVSPWSGLRTVSGQLYDVNYSEKWDWVVIPEGATVLNARFYGTDQPTDLTFTWGRDPRDQQTVVVYNFPYDPGYFRHAEGDRNLILTAERMNLRLFTVNIVTNWSPLGWMRIGTRTYDYGLPYTNSVPVPAWVRVPAGQTTQTVGVISSTSAGPPPPVPDQTAGQMSDHDYFGGTLSNRLEHALGIASLPQRDSFLSLLADRAAQEGDVDMLKQSLQNITSPNMRDNTASMAAQILAQQGRHADALDIANTIASSRRRDLILQQVNH